MTTAIPMSNRVSIRPTIWPQFTRVASQPTERSTDRPPSWHHEANGVNVLGLGFPRLLGRLIEFSPIRPTHTISVGLIGENSL